MYCKSATTTSMDAARTKSLIIASEACPLCRARLSVLVAHMPRHWDKNGRK
uniref:Uncharacterized protein n=1 Tax=Oryza brachyantha TaxID=4533 RepID=J3MN06_ORYBR